MAGSMMSLLKRAASGLVLFYTILMVVWYGAYRVVGDGYWLLALASSFAVYLFVPLPLVTVFAGLVRHRLIWVASFVVIVLFLALFGDALLPPVPVVRAEAEGTALTVMTYNVLYTTTDATPIADTISGADPEVVAFQELTSLLAKQLETAIGDRYPYRTPLLSECRAQVAVWSAYPLLSEPIGGEFMCRMQTALVYVDGRPVRVASVHAWPYMSMDRVSVEQSFLRREEQIKSLLDSVEGKSEPLILLGDLNSTPLHDVYQILSARLTDAFHETGWGSGHTFPATSGRSWGIPYPSRLVRIDYILHSNHFKTEEAHVGDWDGSSDHLPVIAWLRLAHAD